MAYADLSAESTAAGGSPSLGGYLATPPGTGPFPAVVMIHEAFGLNDMTRRHADRLASAIYGGQLEATVRAPLPAVFAINSAALHDEPRASGAGERVQLAPPPALNSLRTTFIEPLEPADEGVDLTTAETIVCVGRGIGSAENIEVAQELATALGGELAASRPVIDSGWVPKARQIGKSGAMVQPKLYLGLGVSGAPEHVEGMQGAELIVAVNTDPGAAIFQIAHYGAVADLFDVVDELTELLG